MSLLFAVFLGLLQGLTEFLPVSSSGHLAIAQSIFGLENADENHLFFNVLLHFGTLISVCIAFRKDIISILKAVIRFFPAGRKGRQEAEADTYFSIRLLLLLVVASLPLVAAAFLSDYVELLFSSISFIGFALIITGGLLYISDRLLEGRRNERSARLSGAFIVGLVQAVAVLPGLSRSGSTITSGIFCGFSREFAVKFSFLLSIPAILGAALLSLINAVKTGIDWTLVPVYLAGTAVSAITGFFAIKLVKLLVKAGKFSKISYYCWAMGLFAILASLFK